MADQNYIIELTDGRKLSFTPQDIQFYPTIANTIDSPLFDPESAILLTYDPDILNKIFTTNFLQQNHTLDMYVKLTNGLDYLENIDTVKQMMEALVKWFDDPTIVDQLKINKENTKNLIYSLVFEPLHWFLYNTITLKLNYMLNAPTPEDRYDKYVAVSDNLSYVVIWYLPHYRAALLLPQVNIYKDGELIKTIKNLHSDQVSDQMVIDDNGTIYNINKGGDVFKWNPPLYLRKFYKHIDGLLIQLSDNTHRYFQYFREIMNIVGFDQYEITYRVFDLHTGALVSRIIPYNISPPLHVVEVSGTITSPSPHMDLIVIQSHYVTLHPTTNIRTGITNHGVWVVDNNSTNWIRFPKTEILLISHSEQIIATADPQPGNTDKYSVAIYKRNNLIFESLANIDGINGRPIAVNEDFLITTIEGRPNVVQETADINFHKITNQTIERESMYIISKDMLDMIGMEAFFGPQNTYLFMSRPTVEPYEPRYIIKKYGIQPYDTIEEFLTDKLD